ncbi:serine/threonine-protein kinase [Nonomuraea sp. SYSU D8015]|uniref:serine/threonine-protein kinase n=1 Tax=Nonomuraea sp. SYSU D8015 TaxID=2593644 RepID=UPI001660BD10|nr:serine/threonine-protein kinase [Nonomuraea sp. SYSU D8015]
MPNVESLREGDPAAVGPYRLVGRLGAGGHGVVYLGQARNGTPVAVKVLREELAGSDRLAREIAAARRVEPFCLAEVLDASTGDRPYIVAEYVDGPSLQEAGRVGGAELQRLAVATATALDALHQAGVLHLNLKPANVLLGPDGARVVDYGIARAFAGPGASATGAVVGTPAYLAPEQVAGKAAGAPADVFAWGSVLVYAATGMPPFGDDSPPAVIERILREKPRIDGVPRPLREVVTACLIKDPGARPTMRDVLLRLLGGERPQQTRPSRAVPSRLPDDAYATPAAPDRGPAPTLDRRVAPASGTPDHAVSPTAGTLDHIASPTAGTFGHVVSPTAGTLDHVSPTAGTLDHVSPTAGTYDHVSPTAGTLDHIAGPTEGPHDPGAAPTAGAQGRNATPASAAQDRDAAPAFRAFDRDTASFPAAFHRDAGSSPAAYPGDAGSSSAAHRRGDATAFGGHADPATPPGPPHGTGGDTIPAAHPGASRDHAPHAGPAWRDGGAHDFGPHAGAASHHGAADTGRAFHHDPADAHAAYHGEGARRPSGPRQGAFPLAAPVETPSAAVYPGQAGHHPTAEHHATPGHPSADGRPGAGEGAPADEEPGRGGPPVRHSQLVDILVAGTPGTGGKTPAKRPARRRVKTVLIAGVSGVSVLALAAAIVWLTPTTPTPKADNAAADTGAPTSAAAPTSSRTPRPQRTRTARPTPQTEGTPSTVPTDGTTPTAATGRLRVVYLRPGGTRNGDCWAGGEVTLQALVTRTGGPLTLRYTWLIDGTPVGRSSTIIAENGRRYLTAPRNLTTPGATHRVTLRITAPVPIQRSIDVTLCDDV